MTTESKTAVTGAPPVRSSAWFGSLAKDITRCDGAGSVEEGVQYWREGCEACLRRTAPRPGIVTMMAPPAIIAFECEYLIEPNSAIDRPAPSRTVVYALGLLINFCTVVAAIVVWHAFEPSKPKLPPCDYCGMPGHRIESKHDE